MVRPEAAHNLQDRQDHQDHQDRQEDLQGRRWAMIQCSTYQCSSHSRSTTSMGPNRGHQDLCIRRQVHPMGRYRSSQGERLVERMKRLRTTEHRPMLTILKARLSRRMWQRR
jgi:hypothetical protein